jgi:hypothetical protein
MATRSTGQIEEGPVGFSAAAVDQGGVSWRFKPLETAWPCVLITRPVDRRLVTDGADGGGDGRVVRAKILGDAPIETVAFSTDGTSWHPMERSSGDAAVWEAPLLGPATVLTVRARDAEGRADQDVVEPPDASWKPATGAADGSDRDRIGAWPAKGLLETQLGPNRNGRKW